VTGTLFTIGYEGSAVAPVMATLQAAGVTLLLDVRAVPLSRKPGFSKRQFAAELAERGIDYVHLRGLGTPAAGRSAARAGNTAGMHKIFRAHMKSDAVQADLAQAIALAGERPCCLLCFEHDPATCHRRIVGTLICKQTHQAVVDLRP
jgi:uncharacterized protein (DUF488 family)